jgi:hypothetical protein
MPDLPLIRSCTTGAGARVLHAPPVPDSQVRQARCVSSSLAPPARPGCSHLVGARNRRVGISGRRCRSIKLPAAGRKRRAQQTGCLPLTLAGRALQLLSATQATAGPRPDASCAPPAPPRLGAPRSARPAPPATTLLPLESLLAILAPLAAPARGAATLSAAVSVHPSIWRPAMCTSCCGVNPAPASLDQHNMHHDTQSALPATAGAHPPAPYARPAPSPRVATRPRARPALLARSALARAPAAAMCASPASTAATRTPPLLACPARTTSTPSRAAAAARTAQRDPPILVPATWPARVSFGRACVDVSVPLKSHREQRSACPALLT